MLVLSIKEISNFLNGKLINCNDANNLEISDYESDSRADVTNKLFFALKGEKFDGHDFGAQVVTNGACALVVDHELKLDVPQIIVADTTVALGMLGKLNRQKANAKVVAITGTCGKTTVTQMTARILELCGNTISTYLNFNNGIGVAKTLLKINKDTEYAVVEVGASHPKDVEYSINFVCPIIGLINNVGSAHLQGFKSKFGVYQAKSEMLDYVVANKGIGIVNADNEFYSQWCKDYQGLKSFSANGNQDSELYASNIEAKEDCAFAFTLNSKNENNNEIEQIRISLQLPGIHNISNALAAASIAKNLGISLEKIKQGLESVTPVVGRLNIEHYGELTIIDDAYNASANAVKAAIDTLHHLKGYKVLAFGDMGELGEFANELHEEIGVYAQNKIDEFISFGELAAISAKAFNGKYKSFLQKSELIAYVLTLLKEHKDLCFVAKGSHSMHMEEVIAELKKHLQ